MTEELLNKLEQETLRQLDYAGNLAVESDAYQHVMGQVRSNCETLYKGVKVNNEEYRILEELDFNQKAKALEVREARKGRIGDYVVKGVSLVVPLMAYGAMYKTGLVFEEKGAVSSTFFRNLLNKIK